jgi:hypothetical protein
MLRGLYTCISKNDYGILILLLLSFSNHNFQSCNLLSYYTITILQLNTYARGFATLIFKLIVSIRVAQTWGGDRFKWRTIILIRGVIAQLRNGAPLQTKTFLTRIAFFLLWSKCSREPFRPGRQPQPQRRRQGQDVERIGQFCSKDNRVVRTHVSLGQMLVEETLQLYELLKKIIVTRTFF